MAKPRGEERKIKFLGGAAIDGAPISYIIVLAAVVTVLSFIPLTILVGAGKPIPLSRGILPLLGWILGPLAGAVASLVGTLVGLILAPHTAGILPISILTPLVSSFAAGVMTLGTRRRGWWIIAGVLFVLSWGLLAWRAIFVNHVSFSAVIWGSAVDWISILLYLLPTRRLFSHWIASKNLVLVSVGLFCGTFMIMGAVHATQNVIYTLLYNMTEPDWLVLIVMVPLENIVRGLIGAVIGTGVIGGMRALRLTRPNEAIY